MYNDSVAEGTRWSPSQRREGRDLPITRAKPLPNLRLASTLGRVMEKKKQELFYEKGTPFLLAALAIRARVVAETGATM